MLNIFICEDDQMQREMLERIVNRIVMEEEYDISFAVSVDSPTTLLDYLEKNTIKGALYFLDVDLQSEMNGIELGAKIREMDLSAVIAFITTHSEMLPLVFTHKVQALDYIIKDDPKKIDQGVRECIQLAYQRYLASKSPSQSKQFVVNTGSIIWNIPYDEILYFETNLSMSHRIIMHTEDGTIDFNGTLSEVVESAPEFFTCHRSFVVNPRKIKCVQKTKSKKCIELLNGETIPVARSRISELMGILS